MSSNQLAEISRNNTDGESNLPATTKLSLEAQASECSFTKLCKHCNTLLHASATDTYQHRRLNKKANVDHANYLYGDGYLRLAQALEIYPVSRAAWYAGIKNGIYPQPIQLGKRSVGWSRQSMRDLVANPPKF